MLEETFYTFLSQMCSYNTNIEKKDLKNTHNCFTCFLMVEKNNELLMKNHKTHPTAFAPFPEVNATII